MSTETVNRELTSLQPDALIALFTVDATEIGGDIWRFYQGNPAEGAATVNFQGVAYDPYPMEVRGFEFKGQGSPPRPSLVLANTFGQLSALVLRFDDLIGARVTRRRTFARFLDGASEASGLHALPDDIYYVERKVSESRNGIEFELTTSMEVDDISLPRRQIMANLCWWIYRSTECGYGGNRVVANMNDQALVGIHAPAQWSAATLYVTGSVVWVLSTPTVRRYYLCIADDAGAGIQGEAKGPTNSTYWAADQCSKRVSGCRLRFETDPRGLPFGGFPATAMIAR